MLGAVEELRRDGGAKQRHFGSGLHIIVGEGVALNYVQIADLQEGRRHALNRGGPVVVAIDDLPLTARNDVVPPSGVSTRAEKRPLGEILANATVVHGPPA